jgi:hypothetical protein
MIVRQLNTIDAPMESRSTTPESFTLLSILLREMLRPDE